MRPQAGGALPSVTRRFLMPPSLPAVEYRYHLSSYTHNQHRHNHDLLLLVVVFFSHSDAHRLLSHAQATGLRPQLRALNLPPDALWVSSPLTRALETFWLGCPVIARGGPDCAVRDIPPHNLAVCRCVAAVDLFSCHTPTTCAQQRLE